MANLNGDASQRIVVVTGGASGIGRACTETLIERIPGCRVVLIDNENQLLQSFSRTLGDNVLPIHADVANVDSVQDAFERAREWAGHDITDLVACAGNQAKRASVDLTAEEWHAILRVHLDGTFYCCQAAAKQMLNSGGGAIVTFSSVAELFAWPARLPYAVAKAGISALTRTLAVEWGGAGIRVNAVAPGYVNTPMMDSAIKSGRLTEDVTQLHALNRMAAPVEIATVVTFLLSSDASFVTGETLFADGGFRAKKVSW